MTDPLTPDRLAELRRIAAGEDWSPPTPEDVAVLLGEIDRLTARHRLEHERAETLEAENAKLHRQLGVLNSRPDVRQLVATLQRLVAQPTTADAYGDMLVTTIRHVVGQIAQGLGVGAEDAQRGQWRWRQRLGAASAQFGPPEVAPEPQRPAGRFATLPMPGCGHDGTWMIAGESGIVCMVCGRAKAEEIAPEDEGISSADVQAQQAADQRAYCPDCGHPETNCACG